MGTATAAELDPSEEKAMFLRLQRKFMGEKKKKRKKRNHKKKRKEAEARALSLNFRTLTRIKIF